MITRALVLLTLLITCQAHADTQIGVGAVYGRAAVTGR